MTFENHEGARACARMEAHQHKFAWLKSACEGRGDSLVCRNISRLRDAERTKKKKKEKKTPAAAYATGRFPGEGEEGRKAFDKICRGKYLAWSSQSFIKVNWPVERTRWAWPSITCPIVSPGLPRRGRPPARETRPLHQSPGFRGGWVGGGIKSFSPL